MINEKYFHGLHCQTFYFAWHRSMLKEKDYDQQKFKDIFSIARLVEYY
jgi:hypothetical protein